MREAGDEARNGLGYAALDRPLVFPDPLQRLGIIGCD